MQRFLPFPSFSVFCSAVLGLTLLFPNASRAQLPVDTGQAAASSQNSQQVAELQKVVDRWDDAVGQRDQYALELVLAPEYIAISDTGDVQNRDQVISEMVRKDAPRYTLAQKAISVRIVGDVAIVNGTYVRSYPGSRLSRIKARSQKGVFSQVYVRARNSWECVNSQRTIIEEAVLKNRKKSKAASDEKPLHHDLGFHFPGIHHDNTDSSAPQ